MMIPAPRQSPVADVLSELQPKEWLIQNGMFIALDLADEKARDAIWLADVSFRARFGLKGPSAASWLSARDLPVPDAPNRALHTPSLLVARLGRSEFLVEQVDGSDQVDALLPSLRFERGLYPVLRQDAAFELWGVRLNEVLRETCSFDFMAVPGRPPHPVVLTSVAGVSVTALFDASGKSPRCQLWCDPSLGAYLFSTLHTVMREKGGGAVGANAVLRQKAELR